ncbi:MAG: hypothetical protein OEZ47_17800, partial [Gammaproteobacteria bacterium]|nr:hypothetical protein [Gammaproteobacteria bacterium]
SEDKTLCLIGNPPLVIAAVERIRQSRKLKSFLQLSCLVGLLNKHHELMKKRQPLIEKACKSVPGFSSL